MLLFRDTGFLSINEAVSIEWLSVDMRPYQFLFSSCYHSLIWSN